MPVHSNTTDSRTAPLAALRRLIILIGMATGLAVTAQRVRAFGYPEDTRVLDYALDMAVYREGVRAFLSGGELYSQMMDVDGIKLPFIYPPFGALALSPFAPTWLSHRAAGDLMVVLSGLLVLLCLHLVLRAVVRERDWVLPLTAVSWPASMALEPLVLNGEFAQINVVIMALVVLDLVPRKRYLPQGWLIGLAVAIKLSPAAMLLYFLVKRQIRPILSAAVSALAATALGAVIRWDQTKEFFGDILLGMGGGGEIGVDPTYTSNSSIKAMIMRFAPTHEWLTANDTLVNVLWLVLSLAVIAWGAWLMHRLITRGWDTDAWLVNALVMLLISPISWSHHWVWLGLFFPVAAYRVLSSTRPARGVAAVVGLWALLLLTRPLKWAYGDGIDFTELSFLARVLVSDSVWLALAFLAVLTVHLVRSPDTATGTPETTEAAGATATR